MGAEEIESCHKDEEKIRRKAAKREKKEKKKLRKESKEKKKEKKSKKHEIENKEERPKKRKKRSFSSEETSSNSAPQNDGKVWKQHVDCILAPMVGASELAFRLLCRKYGAQLAYTPMMSSAQICNEPGYLESEFQTIPEDRPLVCHMSANVPEEFAKAARLLEPHCDAIDLNLGCPQRTAFVGHFGSYLLGDGADRELVLNMVETAARAVSIPIFCKIRLLDTLEETATLCRQLHKAGAALIAIHARYRASFERTGAGARDGPALLNQIYDLKRLLPHVCIISNGNVVTYEDVVQNKQSTLADGIMSAEGILDNPALFLPRLGSNDDETAKSTNITIADPSSLGNDTQGSNKSEDVKIKRKLLKKLRDIQTIEDKIQSSGETSINNEQKVKLSTKAELTKELEVMLAKEQGEPKGSEAELEGKRERTARTKQISLRKLYNAANDKLSLANEYLSLARMYPTKIRTVVFHVRRMCKDLLNQYQLMEECVASKTIDQVESVVAKCIKYRADPGSFMFDTQKAAREKEALATKQREEGKRKTFEARMVRKAKREGKSDLEYYLRQGAEVPTVETIKTLKPLPKEEQMNVWKKGHSQHCMSFHLESGGCKRDRTCAFLHCSAKGSNTFDESEEVAG